MGKCPVCNKNITHLQCPGCGFDGSCNYERYPSLGNLPRATESVNARRAALAEKEKNMLRCPNCGSTSLAVEVTLQCTCNDCGQRFSPAPVQDTPVPPVTQIPAEKTEKKEPLPEPVQEAPKRTRSKMETFVLRLGWGYVPFQTLYLLLGSKGILFDDDPVFDIIRYWLILCTILMQLRLWKKSWTEPLRSKFLFGFEVLVSTYGRVIAYWAIFMFVVFTVCGIGAVSDERTIAVSDVLALLWLGIAGVYHALWHTGLKLGLGLPGFFDKL